MKRIASTFAVMALSISSVFADVITLDEAKTRVLNDNVNVSIAYEQYVQAKNNSRVKTLQLLPTLSVDMLIYDYQYAVLRSIIPEPQKFFVASASKDLALAANVNKRIVQKNLLEDLETTLYLNQYHTDLISSFNREVEILADIATRSQEAYDLGAIDFTEYYRNQRSVVSARTQLINANEIVENQTFALKLILQEKPTNVLEVEALDFPNAQIAFPQDVTEAMDVAVKNSQEIVQFNHLINAASKEKKGVGISWISWGGVGFDYFAKVRIAQGEVNKLRLMKEKSAIEVRNQVASQYAQIASHQSKMEFQNNLVEIASQELEQAKADENEMLNSYINTLKAELSLMYTQRDALRLKYELEIKYIKLKRILGASMITNEIPRS